MPPQWFDALDCMGIHGGTATLERIMQATRYASRQWVSTVLRRMENREWVILIEETYRGHSVIRYARLTKKGRRAYQLGLDALLKGEQ